MRAKEVPKRDPVLGDKGYPEEGVRIPRCVSKGESRPRDLGCLKEGKRYL